MDELRERLVEIVEVGLIRLDEAVQLASGDMSRYFVDCKRALAAGADLRLAGESLVALSKDMEVSFDTVGGLTMGADALAHAVSILTGAEWFSVRKKEKDRGTRRRIEGALLDSDRRVLLVDDVVTRGGSIFDALIAIQETGAKVVGAVALVDRGIDGEKRFAEAGIPYQALVTFDRLGIPPVGSE